jgi:hypothetical protein
MSSTSRFLPIFIGFGNITLDYQHPNIIEEDLIIIGDRYELIPECVEYLVEPPYQAMIEVQSVL